MITSLSLRNLKAFRDLKMDLGRVTLLIGENGTGKSTPIQALVLLKQSLDYNTLRTDGPMFNFGTFGELQHDHIASAAIEIDIEGTTKIPSSIDSTKPDQMSVSLRHRFVNGVLDRQSLEAKGGEGWSLKLAYQRGRRIEDVPFKVAGAELGLQAGESIGVPIGGYSIGGTDEGRAFGGVLVEAMRANCRNLLRRVFHVPAPRGFDRSVYGLLPGEGEDLVSIEGGYSSAHRTATQVAFRRDVETSVSESIERVLGRRIEFALRPGPALHLRAVGAGFTTSLTNDGAGLNLVVPPLAQLHIAGRSAVVGIDEPEASLHPRAQASFATELVNVAGETDTQLILTTHSELVMFAVLEMVRKKKLTAADVAMYEISKKTDGSVAKRYEVTDEGTIVAGPPKGFFEVS